MPEGRCGFGLSCYYAHPWIEFVRHDTVSRNAAAAAGGSNDHIDVGQVFKNLETDRADPGNQLRLVRRVNVTKTLFARQTLDFQTRFIKVAAMQTDLGAELAHRLHLCFVYILGGRIDDHARAEEPAGISDRLAMITGGGGNKGWRINSVATAPGTDVITDKIHAAAHFECPSRLQVL